MFAYVIRRLLLMIPTLFGVMVINFVVINMAPGGPIDTFLSRIMPPTGTEAGTSAQATQTRAGQGLEAVLRERLAKQLCLDCPLGERFVKMMRNYLVFDFGNSFFQGRPVVDLVVDKLPVSISLGLWTTLLTYLICIPLGIAKAKRDGTRFDIWSSGAIVVGYAIPSFLFGLLLIILFATGAVVKWFPLRGLYSDDFASLSFFGQVVDYVWHITLPVLAMTIGAFAYLTLFTKNSFLDEIRKQYVVTARAKGLSERRVLYGHVFRNAMLIVIAAIPGAFIGVLFTGSLLIETIFTLDGLGRLTYMAALDRDYPILFGSIYVVTLIGLLLRLVSDLIYVVIDPRIDFEARAA
jgi:microcin C transport system permease protein